MKKQKPPLHGKIAIVTGAESGIGRAISVELASKGADIAVVYFQDHAEAEKTMLLVRKNGSNGAIYPTDVSDYHQVKSFYQKIVDDLGEPYILVNSAGLNAAGIPAVDLDADVFDRIVRTDLYGTFYNCKEFIAIRKKAGGDGKIVNISSIHQEVAFPGSAAYCASKGGIGMLTKVMALEVASLKINVNNIGPGMILTGMNQQAMDDPKVRKKKSSHIPLARPGEPEEVAKLAAFLVSDDANYATGQTFYLDGGLMINIGQGA